MNTYKFACTMHIIKCCWICTLTKAGIGSGRFNFLMEWLGSKTRGSKFYKGCAFSAWKQTCFHALKAIMPSVHEGNHAFSVWKHSCFQCMKEIMLTVHESMIAGPNERWWWSSFLLHTSSVHKIPHTPLVPLLVKAIKELSA